MSSSDEILVFWFGKNLEDFQVISEKSSLWWAKDEAIDAQINLHFGPLLKNLRSSEYDKWKDSPETLLAKVILTDQFSRNIHRDTPDAFSKDVLALELCTQGVNSSMDKKLRPIQRVFFICHWNILRLLSVKIDQLSYLKNYYMKLMMG